MMLAVRTHLLNKYQFRRNVVLDRTEFKARQKKEPFRILTERDLNSFQINLHMSDIKCSLTTLKTLLNSDFVKTSDPFKEYFEGLPEWKPKQSIDYIRQLAEKVRLTDTELQDTWYDYFERWLVATVGGSIDENVTNHQVLVLVGSQGLGKSTFLNKLIPKSLKNYIYSGSVDPNNKDTLVNLAENMFINLDELENLNKTELGNLKALITQSEIKLRRAYAVFNENLRRRASFMGSVNDAEFLTDTTGNRRYLIFTCESIDYKHNVDMDLVYSQAYYLFKNSNRNKNFKYIFDSDDLSKLDKLNFNYLRISTEEDMLLKYYSPCPKDSKDRILLTPTEMLREIEKLEGSIFDKYSSIRKIGQALHKHGFNKISLYNRKPYTVIRKNPDERFDEVNWQNEYEIATTGRLSQELVVPFKYELVNDDEKEKNKEYFNKFKKEYYNRNIFETYFTYQSLRMIQEDKEIEHTDEDIHWLVKNLMFIIENCENYSLDDVEDLIKKMHKEYKIGKYAGTIENSPKEIRKDNFLKI